MKSKKLVIGYAIAVFLLIFIITFNSVCSITQFDVRFETGSAAAARSAETVQGRLNEYLNKSYLFFKDYYLRHLTDDATKPRRKYVNLLLMTLSIGIAVILIICLVMELTTDVPTHHPVVINTPTPLAIP